MQIKLIKDFKIVLKDMEGAVKQLQPLLDGPDMKNFLARPREVWGNWLLCAVLRAIHGSYITFGEGIRGEGFESDGILFDRNTGSWALTEHVMALDVPSKKPFPKGEARIIQAIEKKIAKGFGYARNKILIVLFDGAGEWYRNEVREKINGRHNFLSVFGIGLVSSGVGGYIYTVTQFFEQYSITYKIEINPSFTDWCVTKVT